MYRRLSWSQGSVRLRVILGESGTHADQVAQQAIAWMFVIRFFVWSIPVGRVMQIMTESKSQYELVFYLPRLAKLVVDLADLFWRTTRWSIFNPEMTVLREPDFCASNRPNHHYSLRLFGDGAETEYMETFLKEPAPAETKVEEPDEQPAAQARVQAALPGWTPRLVVDNGDLPYRKPQEVDEVPLWVQGVADTKTLFEGEDDTEPGVRLQDLRHRPLQSS